MLHQQLLKYFSVGVVRQRASWWRGATSVANRLHVVHAATNKSRGRGDSIKPKRRAHRESAPNLSTTRPDGLADTHPSRARAGNAAPRKKVSSESAETVTRQATSIHRAIVKEMA